MATENPNDAKKPIVQLAADGWVIVLDDKRAGPFKHQNEIDHMEVSKHLGCEPKTIFLISMRISQFTSSLSVHAQPMADRWRTD